MSSESKIRRDKDSGYPKYDKFEDYDNGHTHGWGGYSRSEGKYYEGGHGENIDDETQEASGRIFRRQRGDD